MKNSELYLRCLELASHTRKGLCYNYTSLVQIMESIYADEQISRKEKLQKIISLFDSSANSFYDYPIGPDGKAIINNAGKVHEPIEKTPPVDYIVELADKYYALCIQKDKKS